MALNTIVLDVNMRVAFIGAGTHLISVLDSISDDLQTVGVFDNLLEEEEFHGIKKLGKLEDFVNCQDQFDAVMVTIGDITMREKLLALVKQSGIPCVSVIDKSAIVSSSALISEGCFVGKGVIVNAQAKIGASCILNSGCIVEHGCELGENVHVAPGATLCGNVHVGSHVLIGARAVVIQSLEICSHAYVGAGACVCKNIEHAGVYVGVPAKEMN